MICKLKIDYMITQQRKKILKWCIQPILLNNVKKFRWFKHSILSREKVISNFCYSSFHNANFINLCRNYIYKLPTAQQKNLYIWLKDYWGHCMKLCWKNGTLLLCENRTCDLATLHRPLSSSPSIFSAFLQKTCFSFLCWL